MIHLKLDATDSTNSFLRELIREGSPESWTVVSAQRQTQGRGQQGSYWFSDESKNLTFSILIKDLGIRAKDQFLLNCAVSNGIFEALKAYGVPRIKVKWPNDIMSGSSKMAGKLIENSLMQDLISHSIVGIGLNVNQENFPEELPSAVSLFQLIGNTFDLDQVLSALVSSIQKEVKLITEGRGGVLRSKYEDVLFKRNIPHMFRLPGGRPFVGRILGVSDKGLLVLQKEDESIAHYAFKEIQYL